MVYSICFGLDSLSIRIACIIISSTLKIAESFSMLKTVKCLENKYQRTTRQSLIEWSSRTLGERRLQQATTIYVYGCNAYYNYLVTNSRFETLCEHALSAQYIVILPMISRKVTLLAIFSVLTSRAAAKWVADCQLAVTDRRDLVRS